MMLMKYQTGIRDGKTGSRYYVFGQLIHLVSKILIFYLSPICQYNSTQLTKGGAPASRILTRITPEVTGENDNILL
jgi:hypothetical protein